MLSSRYAEPWFKNNDAFNPSVHRIKQAMFHAATVEDITSYPLPPPHPETIKYFEPPKRALERARGAIEECKSVFNVKESKSKVFLALFALTDRDSSRESYKVKER